MVEAETADELVRAEHRSLSVGKWGNLFMGAAGVLAAWLSGSQALMVDGLFSAVGFASAVLGARVSASSQLEPDRRRPFGYAADESVFTTFRSLSLLALVTFAVVSAGINVADYAMGEPMPELRYGPIIVYFVVIGVVCFGLALSHRLAWKRTGSRSDVLRVETSAAFFDGVITLAAGLCLSVMPLLEGTALGWFAPIGDSLAVFLLCLLVVGRYWKDFRQGLAELAGVAARPEDIATARRTVGALVAEAGGTLVDLSLVKLGRSYAAALFYDPGRPVTAEEIDLLNRRIEAALRASLGPNYTLVQVSRHGRAWGPDAPDPGDLPSQAA